LIFEAEGLAQELNDIADNMTTKLYKHSTALSPKNMSLDLQKANKSIGNITKTERSAEEDSVKQEKIKSEIQSIAKSV